MKTITILAEHLSDRALKATLPAGGLVSVAVSDTLSLSPPRGTAPESHRFHNPARFSPNVRVDLVVEDNAVETVFDALAFAYGAGLIGDAEAWVNEPANTLAA